MDQRRPCGAIAGRFCSGIMSEDDCDECIEFVNTCDECFSPGSNESDGWSDGPNGETLCDYCKAKYLADTAMHAAEMRGLDMQDAPERIWATEDKANFGEDRFHSTTPMMGLTEYTRTDLCITEAECQRRVDAAVQAEREACAAVAESIAPPMDGPRNHNIHNYTTQTIASAIRARGQK